VITVPEDSDGLRLDRFLVSVLPQLSRSQIQRLIRDGRVTVAGRQARANQPVKRGQTVTVDVPEPSDATPQAEALDLPILYQDADLAVIDKPAGMVVHPAAGHASGTLVNALLHHVNDLSGIGGEKRPGIVHRLDRGTSGVMVVAKNDAAHEALSRQFHDREVEKEYTALVWGEVMAGRRIDAPIGRDPSNRKKMSSAPARIRRSREAVTRIVGAEHFGRVLTLARVAIHTGRTHQIRVHLSAIGHPVVGDSLYGGVHRRVPGDLRPIMRLDRPFLHAARLSFTHPADGRRIDFDSPLPPDLESVVDEIVELQEGP
jgi:23S rRNA pseudouridine1911/1915/1917 synthase